MNLTKYEAAVSALAACESVDEVKDWNDKAAAIMAYGRMSKNKGLEVMGAKIRIRALRRLGEVMAEQVASGVIATGAKPIGVLTTPIRQTLESQGIDKNLAKSARKMAAVPGDQFEAEMVEWEKRAAEDGARVSAKLEAVGARVIDEGAPADYSEDDMAEEHAADFEAMAKIIDADDKLAAAFAELKETKRIHGVTTKLYDALGREVAVLTKEAARWMRKAKKASVCPACVAALGQP